MMMKDTLAKNLVHFDPYKWYILYAHSPAFIQIIVSLSSLDLSRAI